MSDSDATLLRMVDQIAKNFAYQSADTAAPLIANHLRKFWSPAMREQLLRRVDAGGSGLPPVVLAALNGIRPDNPVTSERTN